MAAPDLSRHLEVPGRLVSTPTDLAAGYPYGGTGLGSVREIAAEPRQRGEEIPIPEHGGEPGDWQDLGQGWVLAATLRGSDDDAIAAIFPSTAAGASSGRRVINYPGSFQPGALAASRAIKLLFAPDDERHHPAVLFYRAIPRVAADASLVLNLDKERVLAVSFLAIRQAGAGGKAVSIGLLEDLEL